MILNFKSIQLHNFMSFEDATILLNDVGFCSVVGNNKNTSDNAVSNGSGKSAIWEALNWSLTGTTLRGAKDVVRHNCTDGTFVKLCFQVDKDDYEIIRTKNHSKYKTNLFIYKNSEDISGKGIRDTEQLLSQYLPDLSLGLINSVILLGQGLPYRFSNNTPSGRKEVLEKLSKSDFMIDDLKDRIQKRSDIIANQLASANNSSLKLSTEIDLLTDQKNNVQQ